MTVGQNCWTMVHDFLTTHEGCEINDSLKCVRLSCNLRTPRAHLQCEHDRKC